MKPAPKPPQPLDPAKENARALQMQLMTAFEFQDHDAHIAAHTTFMASRMVQINPMVYANLQSHVSDHISFKAQKEVRNSLHKTLIYYLYNKLIHNSFKLHLIMQ